MHYRKTRGEPLPWQWLGAGQFGTGANMSYRRSIFEEIGYFDPALDVGTPTNGAGDLEMFIRVLKAGHTLSYEPRAMIRHRHRREYSQLKRQISFNGSLYALWLRLAIAYPSLRISCLIIAVWWMFYWNVKRILVASLHKTRFPKDLILAEFGGSWAGLTSYRRANKQVAHTVQEHGWPNEQPLFIRNHPTSTSTLNNEKSISIAIRQVELTQPILPLADLERYSNVRIFVSWHQSPIGSFDYNNNNRNIGVFTLCQLIVNHFGTKLLNPQGGTKLLNPQGKVLEDFAYTQTAITIATKYGLSIQDPVTPLPDSVTVSVVIATFDRPDDLRNCLDHLKDQRTNRLVEIVVVDNHPASGLTPPIVADFPEVRLVSESPILKVVPNYSIPKEKS